MPLVPLTDDEVRSVTERLSGIEEGAVFRDRRTGFRGRARKPNQPRNVVRSPVDGRPKIGLVGASPKADRETEMRLAFLDDLEPVDGEPDGFGSEAR